MLFKLLEGQAACGCRKS